MASKGVVIQPTKARTLVPTGANAAPGNGMRDGLPVAVISLCRHSEKLGPGQEDYTGRGRDSISSYRAITLSLRLRSYQDVGQYHVAAVSWIPTFQRKAALSFVQAWT